MSAILRHSAARDQAWGRFYARRRAARVLREAVVAPSREERLARYYADLSAAPDFHPAAHASRAARGLSISAGAQPVRSSPPAVAQANPQRGPASGQIAPIHKTRKSAKRKA